MVFRLKLRRFNKWTAGSVLRGTNGVIGRPRSVEKVRYFILFYSIIYYFIWKEKMGFGSNEEWLRRVCGSRRRRSASLFCPWYWTVAMVGGYCPAHVGPIGDHRRATEQA